MNLLNKYDISLPNFYLISIYKNTDEILQYIKLLNSDFSITTYLGSLTEYIGRKNAFIISINETLVGFIMISNNILENSTELIFGIETKYQNQGIATQLLRELTEYLFLYGLNNSEEVKKIVLKVYNPYVKEIALKNSYYTDDNYKLFKKKY